MAKAKKNRKTEEGDDLIDDTGAAVAVAPEQTEAKKKSASTKGGDGRKSSTKAKATKKTSTNGRTAFRHKTPKAGTKFERVYKGKTYTMTVKAEAKADLGVVFVYKGKSYATPHDAADAVLRVGKDRATGTNGWFFWGISQRPSHK